MLRNRLSLGGVLYLVIGFVVAAQNDFFDDLGSLEKVLSAALAVLLWPLVALDVHVAI